PYLSCMTVTRTSDANSLSLHDALPIYEFHVLTLRGAYARGHRGQVPVAPGLKRLDTHAGVDDHDSLAGREDLHRIQVHLLQLGDGGDDAGHAQQRRLQRVDVAERLVAVALEETMSLGLPDHLPGVDVGEGVDAECHVLEQLDVDATETEERKSGQ